MLNPFINLISNVILLINLALIIWVVLSLLINLDILNRNSPLVQRVYNTLGRICEPMLRPIRRALDKVLPSSMGGLDISPVILILLLNFLDNALYSWFYKI